MSLAPTERGTFQFNVNYNINDNVNAGCRG